MSGPAYTLKRVQAMLGVSRAVVEGLIEAGFVSPGRGPRQQLQFSFQDLMLLRTAHALRSANIAPRKIVQSLAALRKALPDELPMTGLRLTAVGSSVAVRDRTGSREAETGQLLMDFDVEPAGSDVTILDYAQKPPGSLRPLGQPPRPSGLSDPGDSGQSGPGTSQSNRPSGLSDPGSPRPSGTAPTPRDWLDQGEALEARDKAGAEQAYKQALQSKRDYVDAYLNLGALLCDEHRCSEAVELYEAAITACPPSASLLFNLAIALEDQGRNDDAVAAYERALALEPDLADAHFNAARMLEKAGDMQAALRHFNSYRRLQR